MSKKENISVNLVDSILELHRSIISIFFKNFENTFELPEGLNFTQVKAAMILHCHGSMTMSELSRMLVIEKGSFTTVAAKMIKKEIIKKEQSPEDKRVYNIVLTQKGIKLTSRLKDEHLKYMSESLSQLQEHEQADYYKLVKGLNEYNEKIKNEIN